MKISKKTVQQVELIELLAIAERKVVAGDLGLTADALAGRIQSVKRKLWESRWLDKRIKKLEDKHPHIRRMLLPTQPITAEED